MRGRLNFCQSYKPLYYILSMRDNRYALAQKYATAVTGAYLSFY